jgi:cell shape-determining protein MreC
MKNWKGDTSGGIVSTAVWLIILFILAAAISVFLPQTWNDITQFINGIWTDVYQWLNGTWESLREFFNKLLNFT